MRFLPLIWAAVMRKPVRTILTLLSVMVAFTLFGITIGMNATFDKVAASGGYMMACIGDRILSAPFAVLGSIGVVAQIPNLHRLLKKHDVDYEVLTAGEYKRTLTVFGENTDKGRQKFQEDLELTHVLFKDFVSRYRPQLDIDQVLGGLGRGRVRDRGGDRDGRESDGGDGHSGAKSSGVTRHCGAPHLSVRRRERCPFGFRL